LAVENDELPRVALDARASGTSTGTGIGQPLPRDARAIASHDGGGFGRAVTLLRLQRDAFCVNARQPGSRFGVLSRVLVQARALLVRPLVSGTRRLGLVAALVLCAPLVGCAGPGGGVGGRVATGLAAAAVGGIANAAIEGARNPQSEQAAAEQRAMRELERQRAQEREIEQRDQADADLAEAERKASARPAAYPML